VAGPALRGGGGGGSEAPPPPSAAPPESSEVRLAYDLAVHDAVNELLGRWTEAHPDAPVTSRSAPSTGLTVQAQAGQADADVLVMSEQTPLPTGEQAPLAVRPWIRDPIVLFARADETRSADAILNSDEANDRIAMGVEASALGQFTRFGLRKREQWTPIRSRLLRFVEPSEVIEAVASGEAVLGAVYATDLADAERELKALEELVVSDASERSYVVITLTPEGSELARWLTEEPQAAALTDFGLVPTIDEPLDAAAPGE